MQSNRAELLLLLSQIGELAPDLRMGQLIALLTDRADTPYTASPIADIEDIELLAPAREFLTSLIERVDTQSLGTQKQLLTAS